MVNTMSINIVFSVAQRHINCPTKHIDSGCSIDVTKRTAHMHEVGSSDIYKLSSRKDILH